MKYLLQWYVTFRELLFLPFKLKEIERSTHELLYELDQHRKTYDCHERRLR